MSRDVSAASLPLLRFVAHATFALSLATGGGVSVWASETPRFEAGALGAAPDCEVATPLSLSAVLAQVDQHPILDERGQALRAAADASASPPRPRTRPDASEPSFGPCASLPFPIASRAASPPPPARRSPRGDRMTRHTTETDERVLACSAAALDSEAFDLLDAHAKELGGGFAIRRALPVRERRMIGPFCFLDHIGPAQLGPDGASMRIAPHPHIGLQTVTWLLEGTVLHRDSLGYRQPIRPGQLNVMTSGRGISHSEETLEDAEGTLHGVQLWVALPDHERHREPAFEHHADVPSVEIEGARGWLFHGSWQGKQAPGSHYSPLLALDLALDGAPCELALDSAYEHGIVVLEGSIEVSGQAVAIGELLYVRPGLERLCLTTNGSARVLVVGGPPFDEEILMWWNYVARTRDEIVEARRLWDETGTFGQVPGWGDERLSAPRILPAEPRSPDGASGSKAR